MFKYGVSLLAALSVLFGNTLKAVSAVNTRHSALSAVNYRPNNVLVVGQIVSWGLGGFFCIRPRCFYGFVASVATSLCHSPLPSDFCRSS